MIRLDCVWEYSSGYSDCYVARLVWETIIYSADYSPWKDVNRAMEHIDSLMIGMSRVISESWSDL